MKLKTLIVTVAVLAALSVVTYFVNRPAPAPSADPRVGQPLVDRATVENAAKIRIADQGKSVTLTRAADGKWHIVEYFDFPAEFSKLSGFVGSLTDAKLDRLVTSNPERITRLEFKDTKIDLLDATGKETWSLTLGKTPEAGGGRFVRYGAEQKAFLATLNVWLDPEPKNWADTELLNLKPEDVAKVEIPFAENGAITFSRAKKEDAWTSDKTPAGQRVKADKLSSVLATLGNLRFSDTTEPTDASAVAAKASVRTMKLTTFDGKTVTLALSRKPEEKKLKPPVADTKSGPTALGTASDLLKKDDKPGADSAAKLEPAKPLAPEFETIPAGPVFANVTSSDSTAPVNTLMQKRAFQISEYTFTSLPQKSEELFEPAPSSVPTLPPATQTK